MFLTNIFSKIWKFFKLKFSKTIKDYTLKVFQPLKVCEGCCCFEVSGLAIVMWLSAHHKIFVLICIADERHKI
jgi:hypothetical protein